MRPFLTECTSFDVKRSNIVSLRSVKAASDHRGSKALNKRKKSLQLKALSEKWLPDPDSNQGPID